MKPWFIIGALALLSALAGWWSRLETGAVVSDLPPTAVDQSGSFLKYRALFGQEYPDVSACKRAFEAAEQEPSIHRRRLARQLALEAWVGYEPESAYEAAREWRLHSRDGELLGIVFEAWSKIDAEAAFARFLEDHESLPLEDATNGARRVIEAYAAKHDDTIVERVLAVPMSDSIGWRVRNFAFGKLAETDPLRALDLCERYGIGTRVVLEKWAMRDPQAALTWSKANDDEALEFLLLDWYQVDPVAVLSYLQREVLAGRSIARVARSTVSVGLLGDPETAAKIASWVEALPEGPSRENLILQGAAYLVANDQDRALRWFAMLPESLRWQAIAVGEYSQWPRHSPRRSLASALAAKNPEQARQWAAMIGNVRQREAALQIIDRQTATR